MNLIELMNAYLFCDKNNFSESAKKIRKIIDTIVTEMEENARKAKESPVTKE